MLGVRERKEFWKTLRFLAWQRVDEAGIQGLFGWAEEDTLSLEDPWAIGWWL